MLSACALTADLEVLPAGDMTEIGEKVSIPGLEYFLKIKRSFETKMKGEHYLDVIIEYRRLHLKMKEN